MRTTPKVFRTETIKYNDTQQKSMIEEAYSFFLTADLAPYKGEWIIFAGASIAAHDKNFNTAYDAALESYDRRDLVIFWMPDRPCIF